MWSEAPLSKTNLKIFFNVAGNFKSVGEYLVCERTFVNGGAFVDESKVTRFATGKDGEDVE